jgi:predicted MFS family arabinose efflux permease
MHAAMLAQLMVFANIGIFDSVVDRYLTDLGASNTMVGLLLLAIGLPLVLLPSRAGRWVEQHGPRDVIVPLMLISSLSITGFGILPVVAVVAVAGLVQGTIESIIFPATQLLALDETGTEQAAAGQAMLGTIGMATAGLTAMLAPSVYAAVGARPLFGGMGVAAVGLAMIAARRLRAMPAIQPSYRAQLVREFE